MLKLDADTDMLVLDVRPPPVLSMGMTSEEIIEARREATADSEHAKQLRDKFANASFIQADSMDTVRTYLKVRDSTEAVKEL